MDEALETRPVSAVSLRRIESAIVRLHSITISARHMWLRLHNRDASLSFDKRLRSGRIISELRSVVTVSAAVPQTGPSQSSISTGLVKRAVLVVRH